MAAFKIKELYLALGHHINEAAIEIFGFDTNKESCETKLKEILKLDQFKDIDSTLIVEMNMFRTDTGQQIGDWLLSLGCPDEVIPEVINTIRKDFKQGLIDSGFISDARLN